MSLARYTLRSVARNRTRTVLTVFGAAVAVLAFVMLRTIISAWNVAAEHAAKDRIATRHKVSFVINVPRKYVDTIREVPGIRSATWANWFGAKDPRNLDEFFATLAVDPKSFLEVYDEMVVPPDQKQKWFEDRQGAVVGDVLARKLGVKVGDRITLQGTIYPGDWAFNIDGIYEATAKSVDRSQLIFHWAYMNESLTERRRDQVGWIVSKVDEAHSAEISRRIDAIFDERDVQTTTMSERAMQLSFMAMLSAVLRAVDIVSIIILAIMTMILGNTIAMGVRERTHEYGVLRAIGFRPAHVAAFVVGEAACVGLLAGVLGVALAYPIVQQGMGRFLEENMGGWFPYFRIDPTTPPLAIALSIGLGACAAMIPAWRASKLVVTDALRRVG